MKKDSRKHIRRSLRYTAWIQTDDKAPLHWCVVSDISDSGARLDVNNPELLPDSFQLLLSGPGHVYRRCHSVWRSNNQIGVHFEKVAAARPPRTKTVRPVLA